jgi:dienelactone hydrolase
VGASVGERAFGPWPDGVPVQIHGNEKDPFFGEGGDLEAARELVHTVGPELSELFLYPGDEHLFTDSSLPSSDAEATPWWWSARASSSSG